MFDACTFAFSFSFEALALNFAEMAFILADTDFDIGAEVDESDEELPDFDS